MAIRGFIASLTPRRRVAALIAVAWSVVFVAFVIPSALGTVPSSWRPVWGVITLALSAFSSSVIAVELLRLFVPRLSTWGDGPHFVLLQVLWGVFFVCQLLAYSTLVSSNVPLAF